MGFVVLAAILSTGFIGCGVLAYTHRDSLPSILSVSGCMAWPHPTDAELIDNLHQHKAEFDELLNMLETDVDVDLIYTDSEYLTYDDLDYMGIDEQRYRRYERLLRRAGVDECLESDSDGIWFTVSASGLGVSGSSKGYLYSESPPEPLVDNLDRYTTDEGLGWAFRHIEGPWYLYYEWDA